MEINETEHHGESQQSLHSTGVDLDMQVTTIAKERAPLSLEQCFSQRQGRAYSVIADIQPKPIMPIVAMGKWLRWLVTGAIAPILAIGKYDDVHTR